MGYPALKWHDPPQEVGVVWNELFSMLLVVIGVFFHFCKALNQLPALWIGHSIANCKMGKTERLSRLMQKKVATVIGRYH